MMVRVAALQMTSGPKMDVNLEAFEVMVREASARGAIFICSPENTDLLGLPATDKLAKAHSEDGHPFLEACVSLTKELGVWISLGSIAIPDGQGKFYNRSYLFSPEGKIVARYNKVHLFDVQLPDGEVLRESAMVHAGNEAVIANTDFACVGLSVCYDVRFAYLYRSLAKRGAQIFLIPSAFTVSTGRQHWETLVRARAIETGGFVIAAAQCGEHGNGRKTYGHSLIVSPWGKVLAEGSDVPGIHLADLDLDEVCAFRDAIPSLGHDRDIM
ncbi:MAG: carbon-nitrogen hydrolase family protein [Pseudobdellovibrionaceae bacterium]|jgi:predicted amidohydrolase|nr:carbon-nitrogen hydrolase family protein [Pseudobdellovibrionaceae bacterium]